MHLFTGTGKCSRISLCREELLIFLIISYNAIFLSTKNQDPGSLYSSKKGICIELLLFQALGTNISEQNSSSSCFHGTYLFVRRQTNKYMALQDGKYCYIRDGVESDGLCGTSDGAAGDGLSD